MKALIISLFLSSQVFAGQIFPLQNQQASAMSCQWYNPMTYMTEERCVSACNFDCQIIYGQNYTGTNTCVEHEFGHECFCVACY